MTKKLTHQLTGTKITFCYGEKAYAKYIEKHYGLIGKIKSDAVTSIFKSNIDGKQSIVVGAKEREDIYELRALIVHELSHTVSELMDEYGFKCDEFRSYTLQWLYMEIMPALDAKLLKDNAKGIKDDD